VPVPRFLRSRSALIGASGVLIASLAVAGWIGFRPRPLPPLPTREPIRSYRVVYRLTETAGQEPLIQTEVLEVNRPFQARTETRQGAPPGGEILTAAITNREFFWTLRAGSEVSVGLRRAPGMAHRDISVRVLREAVKAGRARYLGGGRELGRSCLRFVWGDMRPSAIVPPKAHERVESCVSMDGILLREEWYLQDRLVVTRRAVEVDTAPTLDPAHFKEGDTPDPASSASQLASSTQVFTENRKLETQPPQPSIPAGFAPDRKGTLFDSAGGQGIPRNSYFESFVRGVDVITVEQGSLQSARPPWTDTEGLPLSRRSIGQGRIVFFADHIEMRYWRRPSNEKTDYVRIQAPSSDLARLVAGGMRPQPGPTPEPRPSPDAPTPSA
jgi:hypothetical protein